MATRVHGKMVSKARDLSMAQVALAWVLHHPAVSAAVEAFDVELTDDEIAALEGPYTPHGLSWF